MGRWAGSTAGLLGAPSLVRTWHPAAAHRVRCAAPVCTTSPALDRWPSDFRRCPAHDAQLHPLRSALLRPGALMSRAGPLFALPHGMPLILSTSHTGPILPALVRVARLGRLAISPHPAPGRLFQSAGLAAFLSPAGSLARRPVHPFAHHTDLRGPPPSVEGLCSCIWSPLDLPLRDAGLARLANFAGLLVRATLPCGATALGRRIWSFFLGCHRLLGRSATAFAVRFLARTACTLAAGRLAASFCSFRLRFGPARSGLVASSLASASLLLRAWRLRGTLAGRLSASRCPTILPCVRPRLACRRGIPRWLRPTLFALAHGLGGLLPPDVVVHIFSSRPCPPTPGLGSPTLPPLALVAVVHGGGVAFHLERSPSGAPSCSRPGPLLRCRTRSSRGSLILRRRAAIF